MEPKVSFIVPVYNGEGTIRKCIESILAQKINKEVIVVDDGSVDRTFEEIHDLIGSKVKYIAQENNGPGAARNMGLEIANGKYIAFIDSDVELPKDWTKKALTYIKMEGVAGVGGPGKSKHEGLIAQSLNAMLYGRGGSNKSCYLDSIATMDILYEADKIKDIRFKEGVKSGEDLDFNFKLRRKGHLLFYSTELWVYHHHPETLKQLTKKWKKYGRNFYWSYMDNRDFINKGFLARLFFLPTLIAFICSSLIFPQVLIVSAIQILGLFGVYCVKSVQLCRGKLMLVFPFIHTFKQLIMCISIWL